MQAADTTLATGLGQGIKYRIRHNDGSWLTLESHGIAIRNDQGEIENIIITARDITEREHAALALQASEARINELDGLQRVLSREGWRSYRAGRGGSAGGYEFDLKTVHPVPFMALLSPESSAIQLDAGDANATTANMAVSVPIAVRGEVIAHLGVYDADQAHPLSEEDRSFVEAVSNQVALALENARLFQQTQDSLADTESLYQASTELSIARTYEGILSALRDHTILGDELNVNIGYFDHAWNAEHRPETVEILARWTTLNRAQMVNKYQLAEFPASSLLRATEPTVVEDIANDSRLDEVTRSLFARQFGAHSMIFVPLVIGGDWVGFINGHFAGPTEFATHEINKLVALTRQAAVAIQNIHLLSEMEQRVQARTAELSDANSLLTQQNEFMAALHETALSLMNRLDLSDVLQSIVGRAAALAGTIHGYLFQLDAGAEEMTMQIGTGFFAQRVGDRIRPNQSVAGVAWQTARPLIVNDYPQWPGRVPHPAFDQLRTLLAVPLKSGERVVGVLGLGRTEEGAPLNEEEVLRVQQFAELATIALDNARLFTAAQDELRSGAASKSNWKKRATRPSNPTG